VETIAELVPQIVLWVFAPLLVFCLAGWVLLQLPSFKSQKWSKLGKSVCAGLVALAIACTALSDKNTNGVNGVGGLYLMQFNPPVVQSVTPEDISNGWRVAEVSDAGTFAPPPANAVTNERWRLRGAYDDAFRIPANGWSYPFARATSPAPLNRASRSCPSPEDRCFRKGGGRVCSGTGPRRQTRCSSHGGTSRSDAARRIPSVSSLSCS